MLEVTIVTMATMKHEPHSRLINDLGGTVQVSKLFDISSQAVSKWRKNTGIPDGRLKYLKLACKDVFAAWEEQQRAADVKVSIDQVSITQQAGDRRTTA